MVVCLQGGVGWGPTAASSDGHVANGGQHAAGPQPHGAVAKVTVCHQGAPGAVPHASLNSAVPQRFFL